MEGIFVYYDPEYDPDCTWKFIRPDVSKSIVEFFKTEVPGVSKPRQLKAHELNKVMLAVVRREKEKVVVIFAQDVAPETVLDDISPMALVRQYLDCGGSIIWVGDIPFFYQAKKEGQNRDDDWWAKGAPGNILGVNPVFPAQMSKARITKAGNSMGLKTAWTGIRPVLVSRETQALAISRCPIGRAYQAVASNWFSREWKRFGGLTLGTGALTLGLNIAGDTLPEEKNILWNKIVANAWFKNFDRSNPYSGFYRTWDYGPATVSQPQLWELYNLAKRAAT